jgi:formyltetrahydrofolate synthetase
MSIKHVGSGLCYIGCHSASAENAWRRAQGTHVKMTAYAQVTPGLPIPDVYRTENVDLVRDGCVNMAKHIQNAIKFGVPVVVAINRFA